MNTIKKTPSGGAELDNRKVIVEETWKLPLLDPTSSVTRKNKFENLMQYPVKVFSVKFVDKSINTGRMNDTRKPSGTLE
jgi:hypothetical protein